MIRLPNIAVVLLKLRPEDTLTITRGSLPKIQVNGEAIYHVQNYEEGYSPFRVKRSVRGTVLHIPSGYPQEHRFENGRYFDQWEGVA